MLTAVVISKNEEKNIKNCLSSLSFCDEIIVVDDHSTDQTPGIITKFDKNIKIVERYLNNDFSTQRNFGLNLANGDWVLYVDADERVSKDLAEEILNEIQGDNFLVNGYLIKRQDFFLGRWLKYGETGNAKFLRLARKKSGKWVGEVHEVWKVEGSVKELRNVLLHYSHENISEFVGKVSRYSSIRAKELYDLKVKSSPFQIILYPLAKFNFDYFILLGFLDGMQGLIIAMVMSFHSFLVRSKLYLLTHPK